jgi:hypothetical protein
MPTPWSRVPLEKLTGFTGSQEIPSILWNPKVHYRTHERAPPVPIMSIYNVFIFIIHSVSFSLKTCTAFFHFRFSTLKF